MTEQVGEINIAKNSNVRERLSKHHKKTVNKLLAAGCIETIPEGVNISFNIGFKARNICACVLELRFWVCYPKLNPTKIEDRFKLQTLDEFIDIH